MGRPTPPPPTEAEAKAIDEFYERTHAKTKGLIGIAAASVVGFLGIKNANKVQPLVKGLPLGNTGLALVAGMGLTWKSWHYTVDHYTQVNKLDYITSGRFDEEFPVGFYREMIRANVLKKQANGYVLAQYGGPSW